MTAMISRTWRSSLLALSIALLGHAPSALAQVPTIPPVIGIPLGGGDVYPGAMCQTSGSAQSLYKGVAAIANRQDGSRSALCPIVRHNPFKPFHSIRVSVLDRSTTADIRCLVYTREADGSGFAAQQRSTVGTGPSVLTFSGLGAPNHGPYVLLCQLPPMEGNAPSYISSYQVLEP